MVYANKIKIKKMLRKSSTFLSEIKSDKIIHRFLFIVFLVNIRIL